MINCPSCGSQRFYYVQEEKQYHLIDSIDKESNYVELGALQDSTMSDSYELYCDSCGWMGDIEDYYEKLNFI